MRRLLLALLLLFVPILALGPSSAWAGEAELHGAWRVTAVRQGKQEVPLPPALITAKAVFDKGSHELTLDIRVEKEQHTLGGKWKDQGSSVAITLERVDGQSLPAGTIPSVDIAYALEGARLVLSIQQISLVLERDGGAGKP